MATMLRSSVALLCGYLSTLTHALVRRKCWAKSKSWINSSLSKTGLVLCIQKECRVITLRMRVMMQSVVPLLQCKEIEHRTLSVCLNKD